MARKQARWSMLTAIGVLALLWVSTGRSAEEPATEKPPENPYAVPDGGPEELLEFVQGLLETSPPDREAREKTLKALNEATDRILAGKASDEQLDAAVELKMNLLRGQPDALKGLIKKLADDGRDQLARKVQGTLLADQLRAAMRGPRDEAAPAVEKAVGNIVQFLEKGPFDRSDVQLGMTAGQVAEMMGNDALAASVYRTLEQLAKASDDPQLQSLAKSIGGVIRRLTLVGKPMEIEGTTLEGEPFEWSKYAGKTVLVDFWATWCGPCVREIPALKRLYDAYHEKGFDIVGISLDRSRESLVAFVKEREIPWVILFEDEGRNPIADYYGVMGIPQMILVGSDGKVVSTQARGSVLEELLAERFGPLPEEEPEGEKETEDQ